MSAHRCTLLALLAMLAVASSVHACLWLGGTTLDGHYKEVEASDHAKWLKARVTEKPTDEPGFFQPFEYQFNNPLGRANDKAVQALLRGDAAKAVTMLQEVEASRPGQYYTAANLGTALELAGDDANALKWIKEGIRRNPESHMFTEWLHVCILEAKLHLKEDPDWLKTHTITGADFTRLKDPQYSLPTLQRAVSPEDLRRSLHVQLGVRMLFVKPKDVIVAQLLRELSLVEAQIGFLEQATTYAELAGLYGLDPSLVAADLTAWAETMRNTPQFTDRELQSRAAQRKVALAMVTLFLLWIAVMIWRKRRSRTHEAAGS